MAFCNRFGSLMRQTISQNSAARAQVPVASMFNAIRCMSSSKLFVGGLSWGTDDQSLKDAFSGFGEVTEARVITDRDTGRSRGFGFVSFSTDEAASAAISAMDGQPLAGRNIRVNMANESPSRGSYGGGFGSDSGYRRDGGFGSGAGGNDGF
uniref:Putative glycine-rich RNA-binding family protein n=1 Tax=Davidia involucrata TaxID=16924 RepID=A0A5B7BRM0_DAVIN